MRTTQINRRDWLKKGFLTFGAMTIVPSEMWSNTVINAQQNNRKFLYQNSVFDEFTPPKFPDLSTIKARLVWNENPYGPSKKAAKAFQEKVFEGNHYSWKSLGELVKKIATKEGVEPDQIMMGPGSSDLLEKTALVLFQNGGNVVSADPSYMSLVSVAKAFGGDWKAIKLTADYQHDLEAMEAAIDDQTKLVYITNPNNPTATLTDTKKLKDFCARVSEKVPVFIDEAYIELTDGDVANSMVSLVAEGKNVLISRTFSKIHGMAGLRIGYMMGATTLLEKIQEITRGGMGISGPTIAAAYTSIDDTEFLVSTKQKIVEARTYTTNFLKEMGIVPMPSETNFVIFPIDMDGNEFLEKIYDKKVVVRAFKFWDQNWCRVSIGTMDEMKIFTESISEILV
ncbi:histidinol-phosphate aminotransferase family protein [Aquimarina sp. ERC-38]|uniref:pyridoxal phosphate-dependent aminotransferase n=1 Tax=Aquimarina sp. ERC-38 TaxID=2949996 RepID=UPI002247C575|nr:histidinol-phosphate transaminase [Aquimarina sp. ERC-38]UZO80159.1 histidinol-phosphate aminotransferase family protein [Aquimarina sp. ERC-38]